MHAKPPIIAVLWRDGALRTIRQGDEIPPEGGYLDLQDDEGDPPAEFARTCTVAEWDEWQRRWWEERLARPDAELVGRKMQGSLFGGEE